MLMLPRRGKPMKYCHRCGTENENDQLFCQGCGKPLQKNAREKSMKMAMEETELQQKLEIRRQKMAYWLLGGMYLLHFILGFLLIVTGKAREMDVGVLPVLLLMTLFPGFGYLGVYKPEILFKIQYFFSIRDLDQAEPSDWYLMSSQIGGILIWVLGIGLLIAPWFI